MNTLLLKLASHNCGQLSAHFKPSTCSSKSNYSTSRARPDYSGASDRNDLELSDDNQVDH